jgi:predicted nuclease of predicted toxin-antitoxin system
LALSGSPPASVILFRLHNTRSDHLVERLSTVLRESSQALEDGAIIVVEESRHRVRRIPPQT